MTYIKADHNNMAENNAVVQQKINEFNSIMEEYKKTYTTLAQEAWKGSSSSAANQRLRDLDNFATDTIGLVGQNFHAKLEQYREDSEGAERYATKLFS